MEADILINKFQSLPENAKKELMDFLDFLSFRYTKNKKSKKKAFSFNWEGGLKELNETSVELQHKATQWR